jgi:hypothetical protein
MPILPAIIACFLNVTRDSVRDGRRFAIDGFAPGRDYLIDCVQRMGCSYCQAIEVDARREPHERHEQGQRM